MVKRSFMPGVSLRPGMRSPMPEGGWAMSLVLILGGVDIPDLLMNLILRVLSGVWRGVDIPDLLMNLILGILSGVWLGVDTPDVLMNLILGVPFRYRGGVGNPATWLLICLGMMLLSGITC